MRKRGEEAKQAILAATSRLIVENGVDGFGISEVAREANVSRTLIYHYFKTRENLLLESIRDAVYASDEIVRPELGEDAIERSTRLHIDHPEVGRFYFQLLLHGHSLPGLSRRLMTAIADLDAFKREHAPTSDLDPAMALINVNLSQMAWSFAREEIARHLGISVEEADARWIAHLRRAARVGMQVLEREGSA
jgi:AcrR family transcriptional regulator